MRIDSHLHLTKDASEADFSAAKKRLMKNLAENNISSAIVIADNIKGTDCADTKTLIEIFKTDKNINVVGSPNMLNPNDGELEYLGKILSDKLVVGLKLFPGHDPIYPTDQRCEPIYNLCLKYHVPVIIHTGVNSGDRECAKYNDPKYIVEIAKKYPELKIVIAHYFWPELEYCYKTTKLYKNIYFDTSALADDEVVELCGGIDNISDILERTIIDRPDNVLFGTDYSMCDIKKHVELINQLKTAPYLKSNIFYTNALKLFSLGK